MTKNNTTIQDKIAALDELVAWFDGDTFRLEQALDIFAKAEKLATAIEADLATIKNDIELVKRRFDADTEEA